MKTLKKVFKVLLYILLSFIGLILFIFLYIHLSFGIKNSRAKSILVEKPILEESGFEYRDLNNNGMLDIYEDKRQDIESRIDDIMSQMSIEDKVGLMWHPPIGVGDEGEILGKPKPTSFSFNSSYDLVLKRKIKHFNLFMIPSPEKLAEWYNNIQKLAEQDVLGIPITISSDPRHGINNFIGNDMLAGEFSEWPEPIGLAATNDSALVVEFGRIANQELRAVGIRTALHPMADLATEPRWGRINGTFGEDADLSAKMTAAYIYGFQGNEFGTESVACMTKHWSGGGPQMDGWDAHFRYGMDQDYPGNNFEYHIKPFLAAFEAGTAMIMPYYGIPLGQTSEDVGMSFNKEIITDLLRNKYDYDGIVCTDWMILGGIKLFGFEFMGMPWGVDDLSIKERVQKVVDAGVDQFGGNSNTKELLELVKENKVSEKRIDLSVKRLLRAKFQMGLFDNPYIDVKNAINIVGKKEFFEKGKIAQRKSIVMLKNDMNADSSYVLPLHKNRKIYVENIDTETASEFATVVDNLNDADVAILRLQTPWVPREGASFFENFFHQGDLDFKEPELSRILEIASKKPTIICIYLDRAAVIPEIADAAVGLFGEFGANDDAVLDIVFGKHNPTAKLPFELPSSMGAVNEQYEDVPYDSKNPLFPFGFGLSY